MDSDIKRGSWHGYLDRGLPMVTPTVVGGALQKGHGPVSLGSNLIRD